MVRLKYCSLYRSKIAVVTLINSRDVQRIRENILLQKIRDTKKDQSLASSHREQTVHSSCGSVSQIFLLKGQCHEIFWHFFIS